MKKKIAIIALGAILLLAAAFLIYTGQYYPADASALAALESDGSVTVTAADYGWLLDGPGETDALIFYPGAKVDAAAYAPLLRRIAERGMDVCLVKMPFRLAIFGMNKADRVMQAHDYAHWYIGGHSLGGAMAANYAAGHASRLTGVILLASYAPKPLENSLRAFSIYGSEDGVLNMKKMREQESCLPDDCVKYVIEGGNHAQFGDYGNQRGDGSAAVSSEEQQRQTAEVIFQHITPGMPQ